MHLNSDKWNGKAIWLNIDFYKFHIQILHSSWNSLSQVGLRKKLSSQIKIVIFQIEKACAIGFLKQNLAYVIKSTKEDM